jgi:hypothetical protein
VQPLVSFNVYRCVPVAAADDPVAKLTTVAERHDAAETAAG